MFGRSRAVLKKILNDIKKLLKVSDIVMSLATQKAREVYKKHNKEDIIIGADTVVCLNNAILGKPKDIEDAKKMLRMLSGKTHRVLTGVCIIKNDIEKKFFDQAEVTFSELTEKEIEDYIATKEPMDKAGSYGIQGKASKFVKHINGDYFTIVGLPIHKLYEELKNV